MKPMEVRGLTHLNTEMNVQAFTNTTTSTKLGEPQDFVTTILIAEVRHPQETTEEQRHAVVRRLKEMRFSSPLGVFLLDGPRDQHISFMLSQVNLIEEKGTFAFWKKILSDFSSKAAEAAVHDGSSELLLNMELYVHMFNGDGRSDEFS